MNRSDIGKLQAMSLVFLMVASGMMILINFQPEAKGDSWHDETWVIEVDTTIDEGETVYVHDLNGNTVGLDTYQPNTGVVIAGTMINPVTLTIKGTLVIEEGSLHAGFAGMMGEPKIGTLVVDGGTIRYDDGGGSDVYALYGHGGDDPMDGTGDIHIFNGSVTNNGTGTGSYRFIVNNTLEIENSTISNLARSNNLTTEPMLTVYMGGIHIKLPTTGADTLKHSIVNTSITDSVVGVSYENFPENRGFFDGIYFDNVDTQLNFTGSAPILFNCTSVEDWSIMIQDVYRENGMAIQANTSHPIMVNSGYVDTDQVDIYVDIIALMDSESTLNVSALVNASVVDQTGMPVIGATVTVNDTLYDKAGENPVINQFYTGTTNSTGIASSIAVPLYTIFGIAEFTPPPPEPPTLDMVMYNQTHGDWDFTGEKHGIWDKVLNETDTDPVHMDTMNIVLELELTPDIEVMTIFTNPGNPTAGDQVLVTASLRNRGTMDAYVTISFYNDSIDAGHMFYQITNAFIPSDGKSWRTQVQGGRENSFWNTTEDMGDEDHVIYINTSDVAYENDWSDNNKTKDVSLKRPSPELTVDVFFENESPMDGEDVLINVTLVNEGRANASRIDVSFWYGEPYNGGWQIGNNLTVFDMAYNETYNNHTVNLSMWWTNTTGISNDENKNWSWDDPFMTHTIYVLTEYNNALHPDPLNTTYSDGSEDLQIFKYYDVSLTPPEIFYYINEETNYTIYTYTVKNIGRAVDNITFDFEVWADNLSNAENWTYVLFNATVDDLSGQQIFLFPGESQEVYLNVSNLWKPENQGELFVVNVTAVSTNDTAKNMTVKASTSAGTVDYRPTEIVFRREDGKPARNNGNAPDSATISLVVNETSVLTVRIKNEGTAGSVFSFNATFYVDELGSWIPIGSARFVGDISSNYFGEVSMDYNFTTPGRKHIRVYVDSLGEIGELVETNNNYTTYIYVKNRSAAYDFTFSGIVFDWDGQTPLEGASLKLTNQRSGYVDTAVTDQYGKYTITVPEDTYNDTDPIFIRATHPPDPAEDSKTLYVYSEDLMMPNVDFYLYVFGVDLTIQPHNDDNISFIRADGQYTNHPIVGENTTIRFWIVNRGTQGTNATFQITKNGTSSVDLIGDPDTTLKYGPYPAQTSVMVEFVFTFTDAETVDFDINIVDADGNETYTINNLGRRTDVTIKSKFTNSQYNLTGTVYERATGSENVFAQDANVTITNLRTEYYYTVTTDDFGEFSFDLRNLPNGYQEGDKIRVRAWKGDKEGIKEFYAYSEDLGKDLTIIFATYDVRLSADYATQDAYPGFSTDFEITVFNTGNVDDIIELTLSGVYKDWGLLLDENLDEVSKMSIGAGDSRTITLQVRIPSDYGEAIAGIDADVVITATSNDGNGPSDKLETRTTVLQEYILEISVDTTAGHALPGSTVGYMIRVTNNGNGQDLVQLGLNGTHTKWGEFDKSSFRLDAGDSIDVTLTVEIDEDAEFDENAIFDVYADSEGPIRVSTPKITTTVDETFGLEISITSPTIYGDPDTTVDYSITVYNTGNSQQDVEFDISGEGNSRILEAQPISVGANGRSVVTFEVSIPLGAQADEKYTDLVEAYLTDHDTIRSDQISITTIVNEKFDRPGLSVIGDNTKAIKPSTSVNFTLRVVNNANAVDTFTFTVINSNPDFFYTIPSIQIDSGDSTDVKLTVTAPSNAIRFDFTLLNVTAISSKGFSSSAYTLTVQVVEKIYGVNLSVDETDKTINLGESVSYTLTITNTGDYMYYSEQVSLRYLDVDPANADWTINIPNTVFIPKGTKSVETTVFILAPSTSDYSSISFNVEAYVNLPKNTDVNDTAYKSDPVSLFTRANLQPKAIIKLPVGENGIYYYNVDLQFDGADSYDPEEGDVKSYFWDFGDGSTPEQNDVANPTHSFAFPGTYQISLTVEDDLGESSTTLTTVKIQNRKPIVSVSAAGTQFKKGPVGFTVNATDEDVNSLDYTWYFGDGSIATISNQNTITNDYTRTGFYTVTCVAFDEFGGSGSNTIQIKIDNNAPSPYFEVSYDGETYIWEEDVKIYVTEGDEVFFDGHKSTDPDLDYGDKIISFNWIFGDGTNGSGVQPSHVYKDVSDKGYQVTLTVQDSEGSQSSIKGEIIIVVEEEETETPIYVYAIIGVIGVALIFLLLVFYYTPKRLFGKLSSKGTANAEITMLVNKLNDLEKKLGKEGSSDYSPLPPADALFCNECGTPNEKDSQFCEECGSPMK